MSRDRSRRDRGRPDPRVCTFCGKQAPTQPVRVAPKRAGAGKVGTLHLCEGCRVGEHRCWRLQYVDLDAARGA